MGRVNCGTWRANKTASVSHIPRRTLCDHLKAGSFVRKLGRQTYLSVAEENELRERIFRMYDIGMPLYAKLIQRTALNYCAMNNITHPFDPINASKLGNGYFFSSNDILTLQTERRKIFLEYGLMERPELIYNINEKGYVLARRGAKRVHFVAPKHAENATVVTCANTIGTAIPPTILLKGQRLKPAMICLKGSMTTALFIRWLEHFARYKVDGKALLILDGASSHLDANIVRAADQCGIILYCLSSNTIHELQPASCRDDKLLLACDRKKDFRLAMSTLGLMLSKVWARSAPNIVSGFRAMKIYPFDPHQIPDEVFAPSADTEMPHGDVANT
ncbi:hypothetical protein PR048_007874 [Dryococelus australis]|uniref:DDE-1 domain-containing protein n=1 Tax=Dryococelus australis TaxID=614101 RepID=A0ABQ9HWC7_9NEOP|nr:hypothetical protein PR048_007874 [Dryococelus australis]